MKELGKNIMTFRKKAGITQEHLAELMHVSVSAVSQWETGKTLPDLSAIPILCHVLNVTSDELLGIDFEMREQEIQDVIKTAKEEIFYNHYAKAEKLLSGALKRFPDRFDLMEQLMILYQRKSNDDGNAKAGEDCKKAIQYAEKIAGECPDERRRLQAKQVLCLSYYKAGEEKKAVDVAWKLPSMNGCSENMLCEVSSGRNKVEFNQVRTFLLLMWLFQSMVENSRVKLADGSYNITETEQLEILQKYEDVLYVMFEKQDFGFFHACLQNCNTVMAEIHARRGEKKKALEALKKSAGHAEATLGHDKEAKHVSLFFRGSGYGEFGTANGNNMPAELLKKMEQECFDCLRENKEFKNLTMRLQATAKKND